jgi:hypothetical protein
MPLMLEPKLRRPARAQGAAQMVHTLPRIDAADVQGLALHGHGELWECRYFLLRIRDARAARRWLAELAPALARGRAAVAGTALTVAFTHAGLRALGLNESLLAGFPRELAEGMVNEARSTFLGDVANSAPALWRWGGPNNPTVHVLLGAFADTLPRLVGLLGQVHASLLPGGLSKLFELETARLPGPDLFRCADGSTPPMLVGHRGSSSSPEPAAPGELLLGYPNRHGRYAARPLVPAALDPMARLSLDREGSAKHDLGRNGCYLVLRQLRQNLGAWQRAQPLSIDSGGDTKGAADEPAPARQLTLRSRTYGPPLGGEGGASSRLGETERGLCFLALVTDLSSQFELMQRWSLLDPRYRVLFGDVPAVAVGLAGGARCPRSEPQTSRQNNLPSSVDVVGGAYFFLPSLRALGYLAGQTV